jgi:hypothetical protein
MRFLTTISVPATASSVMPTEISSAEPPKPPVAGRVAAAEALGLAVELEVDVELEVAVELELGFELEVCGHNRDQATPTQTIYRCSHVPSSPLVRFLTTRRIAHRIPALSEPSIIPPWHTPVIFPFSLAHHQRSSLHLTCPNMRHADCIVGGSINLLYTF